MKKKITKILSAILLILVICVSILAFNIKNKEYIELTQLTNNTSMQMMGYFIKTENGKIIVVDGGNIGDSQNLQNYINANGGKVDYWFLTHFHTDHTGAISDIISNTDIEIDNIVYNFCDKSLIEEYEPSRIYQYDIISKALDNERIQDKLITVEDNQTFDIDNIKVKILSTYHNDIFNNIGNNSSMVFKLYVNDKSIIFLGDTGIEKSNELLEYCKEDLKSDYVQMAHHGQSGATQELYQNINPEFCLWPTPEWLWNNDNGNGYNSGTWKTLETREWMEALNVNENYIEKDGNITIKIF